MVHPHHVFNPPLPPLYLTRGTYTHIYTLTPLSPLYLTGGRSSLITKRYMIVVRKPIKLILDRISSHRRRKSNAVQVIITQGTR